MRSIYDSCRQTVASFEELILTSEVSDHQDADQAPVKDLTNELGRLKVWAGSLGARVLPQRRVSLDYRLKDSQFYKRKVIEDLDILDETLRKAIRLLQDEPVEPLSENEQLSDSDSDEAESVRSRDSGDLDHTSARLSTFQRMEALLDIDPGDIGRGSNIDPTAVEHRSEVHQEDFIVGLPRVYQAIKEGVEHLYKISMIIRRPIAVDRLSRASKVPMSHFDLFDRHHVDERFPNASSVLKERLAVAVTRRRQLLVYNEKHHAELSGMVEQTTSEAIKGRVLQSQEGATMKPNSGEPLLEPAPTVIAKSTRASTMASKFIPPEDDQTVEVQSENGTMSSFAMSTGDDERVQIPPRPRDVDNMELDQFLCPFCFHLIEIRSHKAWTRHVFRDLQAYVCTFDDCRDSNQLYGTRNEWFNHELECHRREWYCNTPGHPVHKEPSAFKAHMQQYHTSQVTEAQIPLLSSMCERPSTSGISACPLCTEDQYDLTDGYQRFRKSSNVADGEELQRLHLRPALQHPDPTLDSTSREAHAITFNTQVHTSKFERTVSWINEVTQDEPGAQPYQSTSPHAATTIPTSSFNVESSKLKRHIGQHLEQLALFAIPLAQFGAVEGSEDTDQAVPHSLSSGRLSSFNSGSQRSGDEENEDMSRPHQVSGEGSAEAVPHSLPSTTLGSIYGLTDESEEEEDVEPPLYKASKDGDVEAVQTLLEKGANVNARGGKYSNALQAASAMGYDDIVQILLDKSADVNAQGGYYGNALQAASAWGHDNIMQILLDNGADIHAQSGHYGNALQAASAGGHDDIVQLLLGKGVDINAHGGNYSNSLQAASAIGNENIVQILLDKGADVNTQGGKYGNALQAASALGRDGLVQILLDRGADVNAQGGYYGNALQAASAKGKEGIIQTLLEKGADINAQGGYYGSALQAASCMDDDSSIPMPDYHHYNKAVKILLSNGADINARGGKHGNALQAALSLDDNDEIVHMLLDRKAGTDTQSATTVALPRFQRTGRI